MAPIGLPVLCARGKSVRLYDTVHATSCQSRRSWWREEEKERVVDKIVLKYIVKWNHLTEGRLMMINDAPNGERLQPFAFIKKGP